jgi:hypothetical protein
MDFHILMLAKKQNRADLEQYLTEQGIEIVRIASARDFATGKWHNFDFPSPLTGKCVARLFAQVAVRPNMSFACR